jgi:hypothetical protein
MVEINWTVLTYIVIALFAISGFSRGWWKEAVTTIILVIFIVLLQIPEVAEAVIEFFNGVVAFIWDILPDTLRSGVESTVEAVFAIQVDDPPFQIDVGDPASWLLIFLAFLALSVLLSRFFLPQGARPGEVYEVTPLGSFLGALLGGVNGFLIINLVREFIYGRFLPGGRLPTEIAGVQDGAAFTTASSGVGIRATSVPSFTLFDSFIPWVVIGLGIFLFMALLRNRVALTNTKGFRRINYLVPYGYKRNVYNRQAPK